MTAPTTEHNLPFLKKKYDQIEGPYRGNYGEVTIWKNKQLPSMKIAVKIPFAYLNPNVVIAEAAKQYKLRNSTRVVRIIDFGKEHKQHYIIMEYCRSSLEAMLKGVFLKSKLLSYHEAARIIGQVCEGIKFAHDIQDPEGPFVHGDIKPGNILLDENNEAKLSDFGATRSLSKSYPSLRGSPNWMSPEVLGGAEPSKESDYFSLGLVAYTMLTGRHPFFHDHPSCLWTEEDNIGDEWFTPKDLRSEDLPEGVAKAIMALLSRNPDDRPKAFETLSITVAEYSIAKMPAKPSEEKYLARTGAPGRSATQTFMAPPEMKILQSAYEQARFDYYVARNPVVAVGTMKDFLALIKWERFKKSRITALADCWSFLAFMNNGNPRFYGDAVEAATHGLEIDPDHTNSLHARGYAYAQLGKDDEAIADLEKALENATDTTKRMQIYRLLSGVKERKSARARETKIESQAGDSGN